MKKTIMTLTLLTAMLILSACGGTASEAGAPGTNDETQTFSMPPEMELIIGTFNLDETDQAIDVEQAAELLPLWKALRSLSESETAATAEVEAIISQIQGMMNTEQMNTITAMELTTEDFRELSAALGIETFGGGNADPEMQATLQAARESGQGRPEGLGGGQGPGGGEVDPTARETAIAERGGSRGANMALNTDFLNAIIEFLEAKTR